METKNNHQTGKLLAWGCLVIAIITEVAGTSFMTQAAREGGFVGYIFMAVALAVSYFFLALSVRKIGVGVAYAIWEGLGVMLLTVIGIVIFKDGMSANKAIGICVAIVGIVCVALGEEHS